MTKLRPGLQTMTLRVDDLHARPLPRSIWMGRVYSRTALVLNKDHRSRRANPISYMVVVDNGVFGGVASTHTATCPRFLRRAPKRPKVDPRARSGRSRRSASSSRSAGPRRRAATGYGLHRPAIACRVRDPPRRRGRGAGRGGARGAGRSGSAGSGAERIPRDERGLPSQPPGTAAEVVAGTPVRLAASAARLHAGTAGAFNPSSHRCVAPGDSCGARAGYPRGTRSKRRAGPMGRPRRP